MNEMVESEILKGHHETTIRVLNALLSVREMLGQLRRGPYRSLEWKLGGSC